MYIKYLLKNKLEALWRLFYNSFPVSEQDDDLQDMRQSAERTDERVGHWVDHVLVKEDPVSATAELQLLLERVQVEPQWLPASWLRS